MIGIFTAIKNVTDSGDISLERAFELNNITRPA